MTMPHDQFLRQAGDQIESLLADLRSVSDPVVQEKAEELVQVLVEVYGAGLERIVELLHEEPQGNERVLQLANDEFVASLLILHGLHPVDTETRVERALDKVRPYLGSHAGGCEFLGIDDAGVVQLRLQGSCNGCPSSTLTVKLAIEGAIQAAAPEITGIEVEGVAERPPENLISLDSLRRNGQSGNGGVSADHWTTIDGFGDLPVGAFKAMEISGRQVVICRANGSTYAYLNVCPACGSSWKDEGLSDVILTCTHCEERFDVHLAGRGLSRTDITLQPLPLLVEQDRMKIAMPGFVA